MFLKWKQIVSEFLTAAPGRRRCRLVHVRSQGGATIRGAFRFQGGETIRKCAAHHQTVGLRLTIIIQGGE